MRRSAIFFNLTGYFVIILTLSSVGSLSAQVTIRGTVISNATAAPIPYANIGLKNFPAGTISEKDGSFILPIPSPALSDTLVLSSLGYTNRIISLREFRQYNKPVRLDEKITLLKPVVVSTSKLTPIRVTVGSTAVTGGVYEPDTIYSGRTIAVLIDTGGLYHRKGFRFPAYPGIARLKILRNNLGLCRFRLRLMRVDKKTGLPSGDLLQQELIVESDKRKGWLEFDLSPLDLEINEPFFLCFEQVLDKSDRTAIADGYNRFIRKYPERLEIDTVMVDGKQQLNSRLGRGAIDLPGTFIATSGSRSVQALYRSYSRETISSDWERVTGIPAATIQLMNAPGMGTGRGTTCDTLLASCLASQYLSGFMDEGSIPGLQVSVSVNGNNSWSACYGFSDLRNNLAVTDSTLFRINSISKSLTAVALMKLVAAQQVDLDSSATYYLPGFPVKKYPLTIRQAAGHLAGFRDYREDDLSDYIRTQHYNSSMDALQVFRNDSLVVKPGEKFNYSPFGFNLIGALIEKVSGLSYVDYLRQVVCKPLGMSSTSADMINDSSARRSKFYDAFGDENDLGDLSYKFPSGGLISTTSDLVRLGNAMWQSSILPVNLRDELVRSQHTSDGKTTGYGLGWYTGRDEEGRRIWYHGGDSFSSSSFLLIYPDDKVVVAILANSQAGVRIDPRYIGSLFCSKAK
ncbi:MAG: serine hydrolase [Chitinophagaceae bacterium]